VGTLVAVGLVTVLVLAVAGVLVSRRRRHRLQAWADENGWQVHGTDRSLVSRWSGPPFATVGARRATEVLSGPAAPTSGRTALSFRYSVTTQGGGDGSATVTREHHVVAVLLPVSVPPLDIVPEGVGTKIVSALGSRGIRLESADFDRRWRVTSPDRRFAHDVVHPRTMARLLEPDVAEMRFRFVGDALLTFTAGRPRLDTVRWTAARLDEMIDMVPPYVWEDRAPQQ